MLFFFYANTIFYQNCSYIISIKKKKELFIIWIGCNKLYIRSPTLQKYHRNNNLILLEEEAAINIENDELIYCVCTYFKEYSI
jgi:hypothetical protein